MIGRIDHHIANFNSIKVRLERLLRRVQHLRSIYFNSIKVRLEHLDATQDQVDDGDFNSIKVRLERGRHQTADGSKVFQFHKGTIRT